MVVFYVTAVDPRRFELPASSVQMRRSTKWATGPIKTGVLISHYDTSLFSLSQALAIHLQEPTVSFRLQSNIAQ